MRKLILIEALRLMVKGLEMIIEEIELDIKNKEERQAKAIARMESE